MKSKLKLRVISISTFILEVVLFWAMWFAYGSAWVNDVNIVSDVLGVVLVVGMLIIIVSAFLTIIQIRRDFTRESSMSTVKKIGTVIVFVAFIAIHTAMYFAFSDMGYTSSGFYCITNKQEIGNRFYFYIKRSDDSPLVEIKCTKDLYEKLIIDENVLYTFTYRCLTYNDDEGVLQGNINTTDIVDNRR